MRCFFLAFLYKYKEINTNKIINFQSKILKSHFPKQLLFPIIRISLRIRVSSTGNLLSIEPQTSGIRYIRLNTKMTEKNFSNFEI